MDKETLNILGTFWHQSRRTENANLMEEAIEDELNCQFCWGRLHVGKRKSSSEMLTVGQLHVFVKISSAGRNRQAGEVPHLVSCSFHLILPVHSVSPSALPAGIVALPWAKECCAAVLPLSCTTGAFARCHHHCPSRHSAECLQEWQTTAPAPLGNRGGTDFLVFTSLFHKCKWKHQVFCCWGIKPIAY